MRRDGRTGHIHRQGPLDVILNLNFKSKPLQTVMKNIYLKSKWYLLVGILGSCVVLYSCTKAFDTINKHPNTYPGSFVDPSILLPRVYNASVLDSRRHERM